ncbi:MAG: TonB-dependent receptor plug domain-containing protein [Bacteroides sp.]|jgi:outer membrane receptor for ferrienterochelin and colicin|nr:TonB-dependent receptor plug domain-containing protein [Bacteroides sp.]
MRKFKILINLVFAAAFLLAWGMPSYGISIKGKVAGQQGEFLPAALVEVTNVTTGRTLGTTTTLDGSFEITTEPGQFTIKISYLGYEDKILDITANQNTDLGVITLEDSAIGLQEVMVISSFARDRQTPVAISNISAEIITERLGTQEFPEILKLTPSVYATKDGGGYGDSRINLRGFDSDNIGVLINGVPVNDMESGRVYWSNWAGLSDVTSTMQVQRGLGASRLAISSVGGTINIITRSTDAQRRGSVSTALGSDGYSKQTMTLSTGLLESGWAATFSGSRSAGTRYVNGLDYEGWSYFLNVSKQLSKDHTLALTAFGAPQTHNQRYPRQLIQTYREHRDYRRYNPAMGFMNGQLYTASYNYYHKPQVSLNHYWSINDLTTLSTSAYASKSAGGGRRVYGDNANWLRFNSVDGLPYEMTKLTPNGFLDYDAVMAENALSQTGSKAIIANAVNQHDWYGVLSTLNRDFNNLKVTGGVDLRYYKGYHFYEVEDLLGGEYFLDVTASGNSRDVNRPANSLLREGDMISYHDMGEVRWGGLFAQAEYVEDKYSAFLSATLSHTGYRRTDYFIYKTNPDLYPESELENNQSDWFNFNAYSIKGGANYNISDAHNIFINGGYFTRAPFFRYAFIGYTNEFNLGVKHERVQSAELGYGYRSRFFSGNLTLYRTNWLDKALTRSIGTVLANLTGLNALHQGVEIDVVANPLPKLSVKGMASVGDWKWTDDVIADIYNEQQEYIGTFEVFSEGLMRGNSAQTTAGLSFDWEALPRVFLGLDFTHFDRLYADFNVENRTVETQRGTQAWQMPSYQVFDLNARYNFRIADLNASLVGNVNNLFDTAYIADATDGASYDYDTATVYYGFGRTWSLSFKLRF